MILQVEHIAKSFGRRKVLRDISFNMEAGTLNGLVGENGSGKSTLLKIIVRQWRADSGRIICTGNVGYCPQQALVFPQLTVEEHFHYFAAAYGLSKNDWQPQRLQLLRHFDFEQYRRHKVAELSGGTQQKLNLSLALLHQPRLLILDEPYNGFDWNTYLLFWKYAEELLQAGCAILVVTHLLSERTRFDHIYELEKGYLK